MIDLAAANETVLAPCVLWRTLGAHRICTGCWRSRWLETAAIAKPVVHVFAHIPPWSGRDGCRLVSVCNDKTSRSGCQSSTDGVACRSSRSPQFLVPSLRPAAGIRSHGCSGRRPRPVLDRPKSEFAGSLSAASALCGRYYGKLHQTEPAICPMPRCYSYSQAPSIRGKCPWFY